MFSDVMWLASSRHLLLVAISNNCQLLPLVHRATGREDRQTQATPTGRRSPTPGYHRAVAYLGAQGTFQVYIFQTVKF